MTGISAKAPPELVQVAIDVPVATTFTYRVPEALRSRVGLGQRLMVPFRGRPRTGVAVALLAEPAGLGEEGRAETVLDVLDVLDVEPILPEPLVRLLDWVSRYYVSPPGEVLRLMLPRPLRARGSRRLRLTEFGRECLERGVLTDPLEVRALQQLAQAGGGGALPDTEVRQAVRGLTAARVGELEAKGLLAVELEAPDAERGRLRVHFLHKVADPAPGERLGMRQRAVMNALEGRQRVAQDELRALTQASRATIRSLVERGWVEERVEEVYRDPFEADPVTPQPVRLTDEQRRAVAAIVGDGRFEAFRSCVLHGITGSGKTEVYVSAIAAALAAGKRALLLLPEIALTPQLVGVFRGRFGDAVAVLHSGLTEGQRFDQWRRIRRGQVSVVIGARSAIFAPLEGLGVVVVDEEHDGSFKQAEGVRYHARDLALVRGQMESAVVVLGSATPSLESLHRVQEGKSQLLTLTSRPLGQPLPHVDVVDMRGVPKEGDQRPLLSPELRGALETVVGDGQQAILFLNRRGHSPYVQCQTCGQSRDCPHCEISLTYHRRAHELRCHYCDYREPQPEVCPACRSPEWAFRGVGTEKLADRLHAELAGLRVARLDRDTAAGKNLRRILDDFRQHRTDVLVGTQMVTKGHDFPRVTLVGVVMADLSLKIPDFRSGERTFQLLAQVAGRAGRGSEPGRVIIQTYLPDHAAIRAAAGHDYEAFAAAELETRRELGYPPFGHLVALRIEGPELEAVKGLAGRLRQGAASLLRQHADPAWADLRVLGPVEAPLGRLRGRYRWQMLLRDRRRPPLRSFLSRLVTWVGTSRRDGVTLRVDVDPVDLL